MEELQVHESDKVWFFLYLESETGCLLDEFEEVS